MRSSPLEGVITAARTPVALTVRVDEREALRYLGMSPAGKPEISPALRQALDRMVAWAVTNLQPLGIHSTYPMLVSDGDGTVEFYGTSSPLTLESHDLARLLKGCGLATIVAVTLGPELDNQVTHLANEGRVAEAAILDAVGSDCAEQAVDELCSGLASAAVRDGFTVTERYSPGYGDLSLATQPAIVASAGGAAVGISVLPSFLMVPLKSVTAVFGWRRGAADDSALPVAPDCQGKCDRCGFVRCRFRRQDECKGMNGR